MRIVALPKPTAAEKGQWYFQRYIKELPNPGEMVFFDRSWYNRAVVEPVDEKGQKLWAEFTHYKEQMFAKTHTTFSPWIIVKTNDKKTARLESMRYVLSKFDYPFKEEKKILLPDPNTVFRYHRTIKK